MDSANSSLNSNINVQTKSNPTIYYGVYTPGDVKDGFDPCVFEDKAEALKLAKKNKKARFKAFQYFHEAADFALNGAECPNNNTTVDGSLYGKKINDSPQQSPILVEKGSPFRGPKPQELVELRKAIECGNYKFVKDTIWQNPRYLVSSGDTPSILQEGPRYNALHVATKSKNAAITELILHTIADPEFIKLLYGDDNQENAEDRAKILLDLYLNTPNKGLNETPLHFASKYGAADVLEILVSYPQCDKTLKNKFHQTAEEIICERASDESAETKRKIKLLLQENYYVPVLRAEDNSLPPIIGDPFSPKSPPILNKDPLSPRLEIHAYAGPLDKENAEHFRKIWKTPPRSLTRQQNSDLSSLRLKDPQKGLERIGKKLAKEHNVTWKEYWPFLDCFVDISSEEGLALLEQHLGKRMLNASFQEYCSMRENDQIQVSPQQIKTYAESPLVNSNSEIISPITSLCNAFQACKLSDSTKTDSKNDLDPLLHIEKACQVFANRICNDILYILCEYDNIGAVMETEIKQLELLVTSYMDDHRFASVNFQKVHSILGEFIGHKLHKNIKEEQRIFLCVKIEVLLDSIQKSLDCFSSDDEGNLRDVLEQKKPTVYRKQIICLMHFILSVLAQNIFNSNYSENQYKQIWEFAEECKCVYHVRKSKKNNLSRSSSFKNNKYIMRNDMENISKKLFADEEIDKKDTNELLTLNMTNLNNSLNKLEDLSSDEEFYTPPSSPSLLRDSDEDSESEDDFNDTELPKFEAYIEGDRPTKSDCSVYNALKLSDVTIDDKKYPNIYRWRHNISLFSDNERESWPKSNVNASLKDNKCYSPNSSENKFSFSSVSHTSTPSKSWLRITGANSPRAVFNSYHTNNLL